MTTSVNFHLRPSQCKGRHAGKLFIRVIHNRQSRQIARQYAVYTDEWEPVNKRIILPTGGEATDRLHTLSLIDESMRNDLKRLQEIVSHLEQNGAYTVSEVMERFAASLDRNTVSGYAEIAASRLCEQGRQRTAQAYRTAARSFVNFNGGKDVLLSEIDAASMAAYEKHLLGKGLKLNTVSFYLRNLRALYYSAVAERSIPRQPANPFAGLHTGVYETKRRALDNRQIASLAKLDEALSEKLAEAKAVCEPSVDEWAAAEERRKTSGLYDALLYFLFCYHARGMSFVDMAHLKRENVGSEVLTYRRRKTGGVLEVTVTEPMRRILSHFASRVEGSDFVFPIIDPSRGSSWRQYETGLKRQNRSLKTLARMAGIAGNLSTHAARHTWATLAKRLNYPVEVIGEALGHRDVKTTAIYLASFDRATMDELSTRLSDTVIAA